MDVSHGMRLPGNLRRALVALALNALLAARLLAADASPACHPQLRPHDQLWLVSDRGLGCQVEQEAGRLQYWRYDPEKSWVRSSLGDLQAAESDDLVTTIFVHGNRMSWCKAFTEGWSTYQSLVRCADERPIRLILWSWPSGAIHGVVEDARVKASRTNRSGRYLAWFIDQLRPQAPVSLWGYSFGARIITGALHLLGGGQLGGHRLVNRAHATREPVQVVLFASALDNDWLAPGRFHGSAMSQVDRMLLVNNSCDAVLKRYHRIYHRRACQQALGYTGLSRAWLDRDARGKVQQVDACCQIGREHSLASYLATSSLMSRVRNLLLFDSDAGPTDKADAAVVADATPVP
jgi:hypothetical protein